MTQFACGMIALLFVLAQSGCAGNVRTVALNSKAIDSTGKSVSGVIFYQPGYFKLTHTFRTLVKDGVVIGTAGKGCTAQVQKEDVVIMPNLNRPMAVRNASGWLSSAKFSVGLNNGLLSSVNAEPTQKASDIITSAADAIASLSPVLGIVSTTSDTAKRVNPACNSGPQLTGFVRWSPLDSTTKSDATAKSR